MEEYKQSYIAIVFIAWIIAVIYNSRQFNDLCKPKSGFNYNQFFLIFLLFSVFDFAGGDWISYSQTYNLLIATHREGHFEEIYAWFAYNSFSNFLVWRLYVWGLACLFLTLTIKRLRINPGFFSLLLLLIYFQFFVGGRQSLSFSLLYYGMSFIIAPNGKSKFKCILIFLTFSVLAFYCHRSAIIYIVIAVIGMMFKLNKKIVLTSIIAFPFLYGSLLLLIDDFLAYGLIEESVAEHGSHYINSEDYLERNTNGLIRMVIEWIPIITLYLFIVLHLLNNSVNKREENLYFRQAYILFYVSLLFRGQMVSKFLAQRFMDASLFPLVLFSASYLIGKRDNKFIKFAFFMFILSDIFRWLYGLYKAS